VVMDAVDRREMQWQEAATEQLQPHMAPEFLRSLERAMGKDGE